MVTYLSDRLFSEKTQLVPYRLSTVLLPFSSIRNYPLSPVCSVKVVDLLPLLINGLHGIWCIGRHD